MIDITKNTLLCGDNLELIAQLPDESIDLIYMDPPFNTDKDFGEYNDRWGASENYLKFILWRVIMLRDKLKSTGSIYLHCDQHESHYIKVEMDKIFGRQNFRNEIIWCYKSGGASKQYFSRKHDTILCYQKSKKCLFIPQKEKSYNRGFKPYRFKGVDEFQDEIGWYTLVNMKDYWEIDMVGRTSAERVGYPTQKPEALLERIIKASSNEGDLVLDPFCGSGTSIVAAAKLRRKYIGFDINPKAIEITKKRLSEIDVPIDDKLFEVV